MSENLVLGFDGQIYFKIQNSFIKIDTSKDKVKQFPKQFKDKIKIQDHLSFLRKLNPNDITSISDNLSFLIDSMTQENVNVSDNLSFLASSYQNDSLNVGELLSFFNSVTFSESIKSTDTLAVILDINVNSSAEVSELLNFSTIFYTNFSDNISINETVVFKIIRQDTVINGSAINGAVI